MWFWMWFWMVILSAKWLRSKLEQWFWAQSSVEASLSNDSDRKVALKQAWAVFWTFCATLRSVWSPGSRRSSKKLERPAGAVPKQETLVYIRFVKLFCSWRLSPWELWNFRPVHIAYFFALMLSRGSNDVCFWFVYLLLAFVFLFAFFGGGWQNRRVCKLCWSWKWSPWELWTFWPVHIAYFFALMLSRRSKRRLVFDVFSFFGRFLYFFEAARKSIVFWKRFWSRNGSPWELWSSTLVDFAGKFKPMPILRSNRP